jgi:hypothetical protein
MGCGHEDLKLWGNLKKGIGCGTCNFITIDKLVKHGRDRGYKVISKRYTNSVSTIKIQWKCGHLDAKTWNGLRQNHGCAKCHKPAVTRKRMNQLGKARGFVVLRPKVGKRPLLIKWKQCGHEEYKLWSNLSRQSCGKCCKRKRFSKAELEITKFCQEIWLDFENKRTGLFVPYGFRKSMEIDVYSNSLALGFEINGFRHYTPEGIVADRRKRYYCRKLGIELHTIPWRYYVANALRWKEKIRKIVNKRIADRS